MDEPVQIVEIPSAASGVKVGDYVFASRWSDADWCDPWGVGHVSEAGGSWVSLVETGARKYPRAMPITPEIGARIVAEYPGLEAESASLDYERIAQIFGVDHG